jgi:hypothetical protein
MVSMSSIYIDGIHEEVVWTEVRMRGSLSANQERAKAS